MKKLIIFFLFISSNLFAMSKEYDSTLNILKKRDYSKIDNFIKTIDDVETAIKHIKMYDNEADKSRACYIFVTNYLTYDNSFDAYGDYQGIIERAKKEDRNKLYKTENDFYIIYYTSAIKNKRCVCSGFASLYKYMCNRVGIECIYVSGLVKIGNYLLQPHAWNIVIIDNKKYICDPTNGYNNTYLIPPDYAITTFFPHGSESLIGCPNRREFDGGISCMFTTNKEYYDVYKKSQDYCNKYYLENYVDLQLIDKPITFEWFLCSKVKSDNNYLSIGEGYIPLKILPANYPNRYLKNNSN